jgi:SIR2-like domain
VRWNKLLLEQQTSAFDAGYEPTVASPVVFHLHGRSDIPESIVVTEDDYFDFLVNISKDLAVSPAGTQQKAALPLRIRSALRNTTLLFVGYRLADFNFRVILRGLLGAIEQSTKRISIAVQLRPESGDGKNAEEEVERTQKYLEQYFDWTLNLQVYWGPAEDFGRELQNRLSGGQGNAANPGG